MPARRTARRFRITAVACCLAAAVAVLGSLTWARADRADTIHLASAPLGSAPLTSAGAITTAWRNGAFAENIGGVVSRSDVVLGSRTAADSQFMPLGNGMLGVAAWATDGFTAQLNRNDTLPTGSRPVRCRSRACPR